MVEDAVVVVDRMGRMGQRCVPACEASLWGVARACGWDVTQQQGSGRCREVDWSHSDRAYCRCTRDSGLRRKRQR